MKNFIDYFEEYICAIGLVIMTIFTFIGVISRKMPNVNLSWTMELVTTVFVWVCALASAAVFKTNSHMGFSYFTDKFTGKLKLVHKIIRIIIIFSNYAIWIIYGFRMVINQYKTGLVTSVMQTPGYLIGIAIPISAILSIYRIIQYEFKKN